MLSRIAQIVVIALAYSCAAQADPADWLGPQVWRYDTDTAVLSLGNSGAFDDTHMFAPRVAYEDGEYTLWYCGSRGAVEDRVFRLGRAVSDDGVSFTKDADPVLAFPDGVRSVLTPTLLRAENGAVLRENGKLHMWFSGADLTQPNAPHALYRTASEDGIVWDPISEPLLDSVYAPTIIKDGDRYRLWYTDVSGDTWIIRHAKSDDGNAWIVTDSPSIVIDQAWERDRLFYPRVVKCGDTYIMWYGAYWTARANTTAIGCAVSDDGITWRKHPSNPVVRPNPARPWESHYTTSQSVMMLPDGQWRMWYATRKAPPFTNKYFAIGAAVWNGPQFTELRNQPWNARATEYRNEIRNILTLPSDRVNLDAKTHRKRSGAGYSVESITYASEEGSRVTALLWVPNDINSPVPAVVLACGHGGSKSGFYAQYAGQLYAKLGIACLAVDTIGEEERNADGKMGARGHDLYRIPAKDRAAYMRDTLKRSVLGKIAWDLMRGIDYLDTRPQIDSERIGVMGYSLGGASAGAVAVIDGRVRASVICGWGFSPLFVHRGKPCTQLPYTDFSDLLRFDEMTALLAPHCAALFYSGDSDSIVDAQEGGAALVRDINESIAGANGILNEAGVEGIIESKFVPGADHRPLFLAPDGAAWFQKHLQKSRERRPMPDSTIRFGDWVGSFGKQIETLYQTEEREGGLHAVDIGAHLYEPSELACFPNEASGGDAYTFEGWVELVTHR